VGGAALTLRAERSEATVPCRSFSEGGANTMPDFEKRFEFAYKQSTNIRLLHLLASQYDEERFVSASTLRTKKNVSHIVAQFVEE